MAYQIGIRVTTENLRRVDTLHESASDLTNSHFNLKLAVAMQKWPSGYIVR